MSAVIQFRILWPPLCCIKTYGLKHTQVQLLECVSVFGSVQPNTPTDTQFLKQLHFKIHSTIIKTHQTKQYQWRTSKWQIRYNRLCVKCHGTVWVCQQIRSLFLPQFPHIHSSKCIDCPNFPYKLTTLFNSCFPPTPHKHKHKHSTHNTAINTKLLPLSQPICVISCTICTAVNTTIHIDQLHFITSFLN
jgi:hypothetical protein